MARGSSIVLVDPIELAKKAEEFGKALDNPLVSLQRGGFVNGAISFGSLCVDLLTGGGLPPGKITDVFGPEGAGKSTMVGHVIGQCHRREIPSFYYDHEAGADAMYMSALGVKIFTKDGERNPLFNYFQPTTGESTYRHMNRMLDFLPDYTAVSDDDGGGRPKPAAIFFIDSAAAMLPEDIHNNDEKNPMAQSARVHSEGLKMIKTKLGRKNASLMFTNQLRLAPGVMFGNPEYEPGGQSIKFYPDLKIRMQAVGQPWTERGRQLRYVNLRTIKNKQFVPFLNLKDTVAIAHGRGFERGYDSYGYLLMTQQIVPEASGKWFTFDMKDTEWHKKRCQWGTLMGILCSNEFRDYARGQMEDGTAFKYYFSAMNWEKMYEFDEEDAGEFDETGDTGPGGKSLTEDGAVPSQVDLA